MTIFRANYCPDCGAKLTTQEVENAIQPYCESCGRVIYQQAIPCTDVAVIDGSQVLLIERTGPPQAGTWALPGGVIGINEAPEEAAARELNEETNISVIPADLSLIGTYHDATSQGWHNVGIYYAVSIDDTSGTPSASADIGGVRFWTLEELYESDQELRPAPDDESHIQEAIEDVHGK